jgi:hypothetical protein
METHSLAVPLKGFGCTPTEARVVVETLSLRRRLARGAIVFAAGLATAMIAIPIPIVHLALVPGALLLGIIFGAVRLRHREVFRSAEGTCPCCGSRQWLGLAGRVFRLPRRVYCSQCGRALDLGADWQGRRQMGSLLREMRH